MVLLPQTNFIFSLTTPLAMPRVFNPSLKASFIVWQWQDVNNGFQNIAVIREIVFLIQTGLGSNSFKCHNRFSLTAAGQLHSTKLTLTSIQA